MCDPTTIAALATKEALVVSTIASAAVSYAGASATARAEQKQFDYNAQLAEQSARNQYNQIRQRQAQENEKSSQEISEVSRRALKARSTAMVQAAEKGVGGRNIQDLLQDFERQESEYRNISLRNRAFRELAYEDQLESIRLGTQSRIINALPTQAKPSLIGTALKIGGTLLRDFNDFNDPDPYRPTGVGSKL